MDRRTFLSALLGAGLMAPRIARAQQQAARRLVIFFSPDGTEHSAWRPVRAQPGSAPKDETSFSFPQGSILEPLSPAREQLTVIDGLEFTNGVEHFLGMTQMLTNYGNDPVRDAVTGGASLDQFVAAQIGGEERFASLELGVQTSVLGAIPEARMSFAPGGRALPHHEDPRDVYRRLFVDTTQDATRLLEDRRSVLDLVREELAELSRGLGQAERHKLELHLESLRQMERGLLPPPELCARPEAPAALDPHANDLFPLIGRMQMDLLVAALACDLTRVASIQWSVAASPTVFSWLGQSESHHNLSHTEEPGAPGVQQYVDGQRWFSEQFRYLLERMAALPEPGAQGSLLDHSVILWITEIGDRLTHRCQDVPIVLAGSGSGRLRPGRYLSYPGQSHGKLLTSICWAMGLDNPSFGNELYGTGGLDGLLT